MKTSSESTIKFLHASGLNSYDDLTDQEKECFKDTLVRFDSLRYVKPVYSTEPAYTFDTIQLVYAVLMQVFPKNFKEEGDRNIKESVIFFLCSTIADFADPTDSIAVLAQLFQARVDHMAAMHPEVTGNESIN